MPGCTHKDKRLQVHHIHKWANAPQLRYATINGITLCKTCHSKIEGNEERYAVLFVRILNDNLN